MIVVSGKTNNANANEKANAMLTMQTTDYVAQATAQIAKYPMLVDRHGLERAIVILADRLAGK